VADRTIKNTSTEEERVVDETAVPFFVNQENWVLLDSAGRKAANQTPAVSTDKDK